MYFVLSNAVNKFKYIKYSIAFILIFIGAKIFVKEWLNSDFITPGISLTVTVVLLLSGVLYSIYRNRLDEKNNIQ